MRSPIADRVVQVPFEQKDVAKSLGARFDGSCKTWYGDQATAIAALDAQFARKA